MSTVLNEAQAKVSAATSAARTVLAKRALSFGSRLPWAPSSSRRPNEAADGHGPRVAQGLRDECACRRRRGQRRLAPRRRCGELLGRAQAVVGAAVDEQRAGALAFDEAGKEGAEQGRRVRAAGRLHEHLARVPRLAVHEVRRRLRLGAGGAAQDHHDCIGKVDGDRLHEHPADAPGLLVVLLDGLRVLLDVVRIDRAQAGRALVVDDDADQAGLASDPGEAAEVGEHRRPVVEGVEVALHGDDREVVLEPGRLERVQRLEIAGHGRGADRRGLHQRVGRVRQAQEDAVEGVEGDFHRRQAVAQRGRGDGEAVALVQDQLLAGAEVAVEGGAAERPGAGLVAEAVSAAAAVSAVAGTAAAAALAAATGHHHASGQCRHRMKKSHTRLPELERGL
jgi:hypothetical protein